MLLVHPDDLSLHCAGILRMFPERHPLPFPYPRLCARHIAEAELQNAAEFLQTFARPLFSRFASILPHERIPQWLNSRLIRHTRKRVCNRHLNPLHSPRLEMPSSESVEGCIIKNHASATLRHTNIDRVAVGRSDRQQRDTRPGYSLTSRLVRIYRARRVRYQRSDGPERSRGASHKRRNPRFLARANRWRRSILLREYL